MIRTTDPHGVENSTTQRDVTLTAAGPGRSCAGAGPAPRRLPSGAAQPRMRCGDAAEIGEPDEGNLEETAVLDAPDQSRVDAVGGHGLRCTRGKARVVERPDRGIEGRLANPLRAHPTRAREARCEAVPES